MDRSASRSSAGFLSSDPPHINEGLIVNEPGNTSKERFYGLRRGIAIKAIRLFKIITRDQTHSGGALFSGRHWSLLTLCLFGLMLLSPKAHAADWVGATGNWVIGGNWNTGTPPTSGVHAYIDNGGEAQIGAAQAGNANNLYLGTTGTGSGTLSISGGGTVTAANSVRIGSAAGSEGTVKITGAGSELRNSGAGNVNALFVGYSGEGILEITNGGKATSAHPTDGRIRIAENAGSKATVLINGTGSTMSSTSHFWVGFGGEAEMTIQNGGQAVSTAGEFIIGRQLAGDGTVTVDGTGSLLQNQQQLFVGYMAKGELNVVNGALANSVGNIRIGDLVNASLGTGDGTVNVDGAGSTLQTPGTIFVGQAGTGKLDISTGGQATSGGETRIGNVTGSTGTVAVVGTNSLLESGGALYVGNAGAGTLSISGGGEVRSSGPSGGALTNGIRIGNQAGSTGTVNVDGTGSLLTSKNHIWVGFAGQGNLNLTGGGQALTDAEVAIGRQTGGVGTVWVDGGGSRLESKTIFSVGYGDPGGGGGTGELTISDGGWAGSTGTASNHGVFIGNRVDTDGRVNVDGSGSLLSSNTQLHIGYTGTGTLNLINGGNATATGNINLGYNTAGTGTASIGTGSTLQSSGGNIYVGGRSGSAGGTALLSGTGTAEANGGTGTIRVYSGGTLSPGAGLGSGLGMLTLDGNTVVDSGGTVDLQVGTGNTTGDLLNVTGTLDLQAGSQLNITGYTPGNPDPFNAPTDSVTVITTGGGVTTFAPDVTIAGQATADFLTASAAVSGNNVAIQTGLSWYSNDIARKAHGDFTIGSGIFTLGAALNNNSASTNLDPGWNGNSLTKLGAGTLMLTGANTFSGLATVNDGILALNHVNALQNAHIVINNGSTLWTGQATHVGSLTSTQGRLDLRGDLVSAGPVSLTNTNHHVNLSYNGTTAAADKVIYGTTININGGTLTANNLAIDATQMTGGQSLRFLVMQSSAGLTGQFGSLIWNRNSLFSLTQDSTDNQNLFVDLTYTSTTPFSPYVNVHEHNMGEVSDVLNWATQHDPALVQALAGMTDAQIREWIDRTRGSEATADVLGRMLWKPWLPAYRHIDTGANSMAGRAFGSRTAPGAGDKGSGESRGWVSVIGSKADLSSDGNARSYDVARRGIVMGVDHALNDRVVLGAQLAYVDHELDGGTERIDSEDLSFGLYASMTPMTGLRADAYLGYAILHHDYQRSGAPGARHKADYDGKAFYASAQVSAPIEMRPGFTLGPVLGLDYQRAESEAFTEKGPANNQRVGKADHELLTARIGIAAQAQTDKARWQARLDYGRHLNDQNRPEITSRFTASPGSPSMNLYGVETGRDYVEAGIGFEVALDAKKKVSLFGDYGYRHASHEKAHAGRLGISMKW